MFKSKVCLKIIASSEICDANRTLDVLRMMTSRVVPPISYTLSAHPTIVKVRIVCVFNEHVVIRSALRVYHVTWLRSPLQV